MTRGFLVCHLSKCQQKRHFLLTFKLFFQKYYFVIWYTFKVGFPQLILKSMKTSKVNTQMKEKRFSEYVFLLFISKTLYLSNQRELTKEDTIKRKDILCSWIGRINIVNTWDRTSVYPVIICVTCSVVLTLCDPIDCSPPGPSVHGIFRQEY